MTSPWWISLIEAFLIINLLLLTFAYMTWVERKVLGRMQLRYGPNGITLNAASAVNAESTGAAM